MDWANERYVRLYVRDTTTWKLLPWQSRLLLPAIMRKLDRSGIIDIGDDGDEGLAAVVEVPLEFLQAGLPELLRRRVFQLVRGKLVMPNFLEAQEAKQSDAQRKRESREKQRVAALQSQPVTTCPDQSQKVTPSLAEPSRAEPSLPPIVPQGGQVGLALEPTQGSTQDTDSQAESIRAVFAHYRTHRPRSYRDPQPTGKEWRQIRARLREGITVAELCRAIDGYMVDPFSQGHNDHGKKYDGIDLITRDEAHVRKGIDFADNPPRPRVIQVPPSVARWATPEVD
jgi:hypothetical protein